MSLTADIEAIMESPDTSYWLKDTLTSALKRDCIDAAGDAEILFQILERHAIETLEAARANLNLRPDLDQYSIPDLALSAKGITR
ncbi:MULTISPECIES: hypothetical protein [Pseudomonas syringae group]|uniref:hypothetical protein n=1 Tax=Pseudomonas syringae group TaxID=136849 RepID=UPI0006D62832|nr:hypothetical protein [Pseudomonas coronafaciens]KPX32994.1 Uncharacterized protein ALO77_00748 [Pseudomonas coronafaciens pv. garcae]RMV81988.1 hypothetical protein ALP02_02445 [Pseudomonas coronafaciens pv. garcae]